MEQHARDTLSPRIGTPQELSERLAFEYARGARYGTPLSLLALHFFLWNGRDEEECMRLERHVSEHFMNAVRVSDGLYDFGLRGCFVGVLPHTRAADADVPRARLEQRANHRPVGEIGPVKIDVFPVDLDVPDVVTLLAKLEAHFRSQALVPPGSGGPPPAPARLPLRGLAAFERTLRVELNLAGREASHMSVLSLFGVHAETAPPGLLARHVANIAPHTIRASDPVFSVGPSHVALVMPRTAPGAAAAVGQRIAAALGAAFPDAAYGEIAQKALEFDRTHRDVPAILATLRRVAPLSERVG